MRLSHCGSLILIEEELIELATKYHIGGYRYNGIPSARVQQQVRTLQTNAKIPLFVACNTETGGNGSGTDGTYIASQIKIGATRNAKYAYEMARMGNEEAAAMGNNMAFGGGGEIPWYVHDMTTIGISVNAPTMLADVPTVRTYINAYDSKPHTMDALVEKLLTGPEAFTGKDPIDSFCGLWDTRI